MIFVLATIFLGHVSADDRRTEWSYFVSVPKHREEICPFIGSRDTEDLCKLWHSQYGLIHVNINQGSRSESGTK